MVSEVDLVTGARATPSGKGNPHPNLLPQGERTDQPRRFLQCRPLIRKNSGFCLSKRLRPAKFPDARTHFRQSSARQG